MQALLYFPPHPPPFHGAIVSRRRVFVNTQFSVLGVSGLWCDTWHLASLSAGVGVHTLRGVLWCVGGGVWGWVSAEVGGVGLESVMIMIGRGGVGTMSHNL